MNMPIFAVTRIEGPKQIDVLQYAVAVAPDIDDVAVMGEPIHEGAASLRSLMLLAMGGSTTAMGKTASPLSSADSERYGLPRNVGIKLNDS